MLLLKGINKIEGHGIQKLEEYYGNIVGQFSETIFVGGI